MLPYAVNRKIVVSGSYVELYEFEKSYWVGFPRLRPNPAYQHYKELVFRVKSDNEQSKIRDDNIRRSRQKIRRLINSNQDLVKFMTLTFKENITDLAIANRYFDIFIKRLKRQYPNFKYLCVPEFQKRGAVHYHLLCNLPFINSEKLNSIWCHGFAFIRKVDNVDNMGAYVCKYLGKANFDPRYFKKRKFFYSNNLVQPLVVDKSEDVSLILNNLPVDNLLFCKKTFDFETFTAHLGMLYYKQFKLADFINAVPSGIKEKIWEMKKRKSKTSPPDNTYPESMSVQKSMLKNPRMELAISPPKQLLLKFPEKFKIF